MDVADPPRHRRGQSSNSSFRLEEIITPRAKSHCIHKSHVLENRASRASCTFSPRKPHHSLRSTRPWWVYKAGRIAQRHLQTDRRGQPTQLVPTLLLRPNRRKILLLATLITLSTERRRNLRSNLRSTTLLSQEEDSVASRRTPQTEEVCTWNSI